MIDINKYKLNKHFPVMIREVVDLISPLNGKTVLDCTFGNGGYTRCFLEGGANVIALDRDENVIDTAHAIKQEFPNFKFYNIKFSDISSIINKEEADCIVLDLGLSTMQIKNAERGFSFMEDAYLDMRMGHSLESASDFINNSSEEDIANVIYKYGEERQSRKIAKYIVLARKEKPILKTSELTNIIHRAIGARSGNINSATKTFQAIRIYINQELEELRKILEISCNILKSGGILAVVSFHSLEDRIVKEYMKKNSKNGISSPNRHLPFVVNEVNVLFSEVFKLYVPKEDEILLNPPSRSAKLRVAIKK